MKNSIYLHIAYLITFMNSDGGNLFQNGLFLHDFMDEWINWRKLNLEYMSIYIDTFLRTVSNGHKLEE